MRMKALLQIEAALIVMFFSMAAICAAYELVTDEQEAELGSSEG